MSPITEPVERSNMKFLIISTLHFYSERFSCVYIVITLSYIKGRRQQIKCFWWCSIAVDHRKKTTSDWKGKHLCDCASFGVSYWRFSISINLHATSKGCFVRVFFQLCVLYIQYFCIPIWMYMNVCRDHDGKNTCLYLTENSQMYYKWPYFLLCIP